MYAQEANAAQPPQHREHVHLTRLHLTKYVSKTVVTPLFYCTCRSHFCCLASFGRPSITLSASIDAKLKALECRPLHMYTEEAHKAHPTQHLGHVHLTRLHLTKYVSKTVVTPLFYCTCRSHFCCLASWLAFHNISCIGNERRQKAHLRVAHGPRRHDAATGAAVMAGGGGRKILGDLGSPPRRQRLPHILHILRVWAPSQRSHTCKAHTIAPS